MCSNHDDGELEPLRGSLSTLKFDENGGVLDRKTCMKCKTADANVVIRVNDPFCRDCFLQYCTHKFRSAFGKSKLIRDGERVLVGFSGGAASSAMLHLIQEGRSVRAQKKLRFTPSFLFIDELSILPVKDEEAEMYRVKIETQLQKSGYDYHIIKLEQLFVETSSSSCAHDATPTEKLRRFVNSASSLTAQEYLVKTLRYDLLAQFAKSGNFDKVIVGDTASRLSVKILSYMAQGKGAHIAYDTSFADDRYDLLIIRPMRDFTSKEVAMYNTFYCLSPLTIPLLSTKSKVSSSIDRLTEEFVGGLQADFPATVNTIMRTGDKLMYSANGLPALTQTSPTQICLFCKAPLDTDVPISSALNSIRFSETVSQRRQEELDIIEPTNTESPPVSGDGNRKKHILEQTCYGCRQIIDDLDDDAIAELPSGVTAALQRRSEMRSSVESYLLT